MPQFNTHSDKTPVSIITGFLGSGKTSLLNHILKNREDKSIAVIENEFGECSIDSHLVADNLVEKEDLVSVENGCMCCSLRKDIVRAFSEIDKRSRARSKKVDYILLETTGLADPAPVAFTFFANPWIAARFRLDSIICVVDSKYLLQHLDDKPHGAVNEAVQQIAFADLILLNKLDLVNPEEKEEITTAIRTINNTAKIIECQLNKDEGRPQLERVLGQNTFSVQRAQQVDPDFLASDSENDTDAEEEPASSSLEKKYCIADPAVGQKRTAEQIGSDCEDECHECQVKHTTRQPKRKRKALHDLSDVSSVGITAFGALDEFRFNMFMRDVLAEKAKDIFRCKGVLLVHGYGNTKFVFQGVHETICYGPAEKPWADYEAKVNRVVFIGRSLDRKALLEGFRTCIWVPLPDGWEEAVDQTSNRRYYYNRKTKEKSWTRPDAIACAHARVHHSSTEQPKHVAPRRSASFLPAIPSPVASAEQQAQPESEPQPQVQASTA